MRWSRLAAFVMLAAAAGCGGKIAPLGDAGDAGNETDGPDEEEVELASPDGGPVVDRIFPASGPNSGGTRVTVVGSGFGTDGGTQISFAGYPASDVTCESEARCVATSPYAGYSAAADTVDVQATVGGELGALGSRSSAARVRDQFTFTPGPPCRQALTCPGSFYPQIVFDCPGTVAFYLYPRTPDQVLVATAASYTAGTNDVGAEVAACYGDPATTSCTPYSTFEAQVTYCGDPNFCFVCERWLLGTCYVDGQGTAGCLR